MAQTIILELFQHKWTYWDYLEVSLDPLDTSGGITRKRTLQLDLLRLQKKKKKNSRKPLNLTQVSPRFTTTLTHIYNSPCEGILSPICWLGFLRYVWPALHCSTSNHPWSSDEIMPSALSQTMVEVICSVLLHLQISS